MKIQFEDDPQFLCAVRAGIMDALRSPDFLRALAAEMGPEVIWLSSEQARGVTQLAPSTFARWVRKYRSKGLLISYAAGRKEPRYQFASLQRVMHAAAVGDELKPTDLMLLSADRKSCAKSRRKAT